MTKITLGKTHVVDIPKDATDIGYCHVPFGFRLSYNQVETKEPGKVVLLADQERKIETFVWFGWDGKELSRQITTGDWEVKKPTIDPQALAKLAVKR